MEKVLDVMMLGQVRFHELSMRGRVVLSQLPFNVMLLLVCAIAAIADASVFTDPGFLIGQGIALVILILSFALPWDRLPYGLFLVLPILDFVPIGILHYSNADSLRGLNLLAVLPIMWLAGSGFRPRIMVPIGGLASLLIVWVPHFIDGTATPRTLAAEVLIPFMLFSIGIGTSVMTLSAMAQQERVEELLRRSETRERLLDTVLETVDVGVLVLDEEGQSAFMNAKQRQLYVAALPEGVPTDREEALLVFREGSEDPVPPDERVLRRAKAGETVEHEVFRLGRGAEARTVSISARPFDDAAGQRAGTVLASADVTDVVAAVHARDKFLAAMSHEFRTPLTNILGYAELLQDEETLSPAARSDLQIMTRNARHLNHMVDGILAAALTGDEAAAIRLPLDLSELVRQAGDSSGPEAAGRAIMLNVSTDGPLPVLGDRTGLVRVLDNLVSNALKYSASGTTVTLTAAAEGRWAVCTVRDQGFGIAAEDLKRVFTRFQRSDAAVRSGVPGTGLGLALAKEVAERHDGELECTSEVGVGSVFTLRLPLRVPPTWSAPKR
ncbi:ATP-binding protein [Sinomonas albida]|uniref:ATP-binding protein n=1 Tax=Sinomonas albida TaxID=369942 RepID=UPI0010A76F4F|nr:ATP-binding protein [Sinomonas albida]